MSLSIFSLFHVIDRAKNLSSYSVANLGFVALANAALDKEESLFLVWETCFEEDIYYDLLVVSDGLRSACIPAPLLAKPNAWRSICKKEIPKQHHDRNIEGIAVMSDFEIKTNLNSLLKTILTITPDCQSLANKYLANKECQICPYFAKGHNANAIHCTIHPFGYPFSSHQCNEWEPLLGIEESLATKERILYALNWEKKFKVN